MRSEIGRLQAFFADVCVPLRRGDVRVAEQFLHRAQIGTVVEKVRRKGVTQRVRVCRVDRSAVENAPNIARGEAIPSAVHEQCRTNRGVRFKFVAKLQPFAQRRDARRTERNTTLFGTFAPHRGRPRLQVDRSDGERAQFADT